MDICLATGWQISPLEILKLDEAYPRIWNDIMVELWQRQLVKEQMGES